MNASFFRMVKIYHTSLSCRGCMTIFSKMAKAMPELIDWLCFDERKEKIAFKAREKNPLLTLGATAEEIEGALFGIISYDEIQERRKLAEGLEALRKFWVKRRGLRPQSTFERLQRSAAAFMHRFSVSDSSGEAKYAEIGTLVLANGLNNKI